MVRVVKELLVFVIIVSSCFNIALSEFRFEKPQHNGRRKPPPTPARPTPPPPHPTPTLPPPPPSPMLRPPVNHTQLVLTWSPTFCKDRNCKTGVTHGFYMHGLWPADYKGSTLYLQQCREYTIGDLINQIPKSTQKLLHRYWPALLPYNPQRFWSHEFQQHGSCTSLTDEAYFLTSTRRFKDWHQTNSIDQILRRANIIPHETILYSRAEIEQAMEPYIPLPGQIYVSCEPTQGNSVPLKEIFICYNEIAENIVSCPMSTLPRGCRDPNAKNIKYTPIPANNQMAEFQAPVSHSPAPSPLE